MDDFITVYLSLRGDGDEPSLQEKEQLLQEIALFSLASHLFWGIWGIVNINQEIEFGYWVSVNFLHIPTSHQHQLFLISRSTQISESTNTLLPKKITSRLNLMRGMSVISRRAVNNFHLHVFACNESLLIKSPWIKNISMCLRRNNSNYD
jgi:hypothetical protein